MAAKSDHSEQKIHEGGNHTHEANTKSADPNHTVHFD